MSRNAAAIGALVLVGGLLWLVTAWPTPPDSPEPAAPEQPAAPVLAPEPPRAPEPPQLAPPPRAEELTAQQPPEAPPQPPPMPAPHTPPDDMFAKDQGPVAEYKAIYEREPRSSNAQETESKIRAAFVAADGAPDLFRSVLCRQTVCKLELNWTSQRLGAYVAGITRATQAGFGTSVAVAPAGPADGDKVRPISVYIKRAQPSAAPAAQPQAPQPATALPPAGEAPVPATTTN